MKRQMEINDTHDETIESAKADLADWLKDQLKAEPDVDLDSLEPHDTIFEIADSATPVYTREIEDWHYLYGSELRQAYQDAGIGHGDEDNHLAVCIFCYIEAQLWEYWRELVETENDRRVEAEDSTEAEA
jgi:hypothetical protein